MKNITIVLLAIFVVSCSGTKPDSIIRNDSFSYDTGVPHLSISSNGYYDDNNDININITTELIPSSLITTTNKDANDGNLIAEYDIEYRVYKSGNERSEIINHRKKEKFVFNKSPTPELYENLIVTENFDIESAGSYEIHVVVTDLVSEKTTHATDSVIIPDINSGGFGVSNVSFTAIDHDKPENDYIPITTYEVTKDYDELQFENQITNDTSGHPISVEVRVIKFDSDTEPALRMSAPEYMLSRLQINGIDYNNPEVIYTQDREFETGDEVFTYRVGMPIPDIGNYRYEISVLNIQEDTRLTRAFDFGVKRADFPFVRSVSDLLDPLYYLMDKKEFNRMKEIQDKDSLKNEIDNFWIRNIKSEQKAKDLINLYYERVEEANKYFSSYKEGWKTDIGLIYILFGPPLYTYDTFNYIHWSYSSDRYSPRFNYYFINKRRQSRVFPFDVYHLDRSQPQLRDNEYLIMDKWLSGNVLY